MERPSRVQLQSTWWKEADSESVRTDRGHLELELESMGLWDQSRRIPQATSGALTRVTSDGSVMASRGIVEGSRMDVVL